MEEDKSWLMTSMGWIWGIGEAAVRPQGSRTAAAKNETGVGCSGLGVSGMAGMGRKRNTFEPRPGDGSGDGLSPGGATSSKD